MRFRHLLPTELHAEQFALLPLLEQLEDVIWDNQWQLGPGRCSRAKTLKVVAQLARTLETGLIRTLRFEARELPGLIRAQGGGSCWKHLQGYHCQLLRQAVQTLEQARLLLNDPLVLERWDGLSESALQLTHQLHRFLQLSEVELLPLLDDLLDEAVDQRLTRQLARFEGRVPHAPRVRRLGTAFARPPAIPPRAAWA